jgi:predicted RNA binding protein YcfA (HicA-like mRNA interferase family)
MSTGKKLILQILSGTADANIRFEDMCHLLHYLGFEERVRGSHHLFRRDGVEEKLNVQRDGDKAKVYQVGQVRRILLKYKLGDID